MNQNLSRQWWWVLLDILIMIYLDSPIFNEVNVWYATNTSYDTIEYINKSWENLKKAYSMNVPSSNFIYWTGLLRVALCVFSHFNEPSRKAKLNTFAENVDLIKLRVPTTTWRRLNPLDKSSSKCPHGMGLPFFWGHIGAY